MSIKAYISAFGTGLLFAVGLALSGMTLPSKVISFFDFSRGFESWDPSLAFVMGGGMLVYLPIYRFVAGRARPMLDRPLLEDRFRLPSRRDIDFRLVGGAALFGLGWGLGGFCPGPALTSVGALSGKALIMVAGMLAGMFVFQRFDDLRARQRARNEHRSGEAEKAA